MPPLPVIVVDRTLWTCAGGHLKGAWTMCRTGSGITDGISLYLVATQQTTYVLQQLDFKTTLFPGGTASRLDAFF